MHINADDTKCFLCSALCLLFINNFFFCSFFVMRLHSHKFKTAHMHHISWLLFYSYLFAFHSAECYSIYVEEKKANTFCCMRIWMCVFLPACVLYVFLNGPGERENEQNRVFSFNRRTHKEAEMLRHFHFFPFILCCVHISLFLSKFNVYEKIKENFFFKFSACKPNVIYLPLAKSSECEK